MARLLLIDDDPGLLAEKVRHAFPSPAHQVEIAYTARKAWIGSRLRCRMSFSSTCVFRTRPAWMS